MKSSGNDEILNVSRKCRRERPAALLPPRYLHPVPPAFARLLATLPEARLEQRNHDAG